MKRLRHGYFTAVGAVNGIDQQRLWRLIQARSTKLHCCDRPLARGGRWNNSMLISRLTRTVPRKPLDGVVGYCLASVKVPVADALNQSVAFLMALQGATDLMDIPVLHTSM